MSAHISLAPGANLRCHRFPPSRWRFSLRRRFSASASSPDDGETSYLEMWKKAVERDRKFQLLRQTKLPPPASEAEEILKKESLEKKTEAFSKILEVPKEERDRIQRLQVIDRAAAAIAAARAIIKEPPPKPADFDAPDLRSDRSGSSELQLPDAGTAGNKRRRINLENVALLLKSYWMVTCLHPLLFLYNQMLVMMIECYDLQGGSSFLQSRATKFNTPGPNFWSWSPPTDDRSESAGGYTSLQPAKKSNSYPVPSNPVLEKDRSAEVLPIPFESILIENEHRPPLPPLQSFMEVEKEESETSILDLSTVSDAEDKLSQEFLGHAARAAEALGKSDETLLQGVNPDGSKWWRETGTEERPDGVVCRWTLIRGLTADGAVEWEDKFWEASDQFDYKELGSEKSGRDASGNVWREYWKESMWQDLKSGLMHMEKTADKWGKNENGGEWHEKWWEHYNASGQAEKWAHKWCCIDPNTPLEAGHAHIWHERWGEKYDGKGGSVKYTDKWAERSEGYDKWSKWGDKWDEHFDPNGHGVKQGETWWEGTHGERWNRTWGEQHNGSGWVHKYGMSSSGEHWDTHEQQETWYERHPHFGFDHCFENSRHLRSVSPPPPKDM